jgi:hypothetical protein
MTTHQDTSERRREQVRQLEAATREVMTSEGFQRWITTRRAFHDYSIGNQLLLAMQTPTVGGEPVAEFATRVAGFRAWKKVDRSVVKGAKGLRILAPCPVKREDPDTSEVVERVFFKLVSVFDVSQTDGEPLAELPMGSIAGEDHAAMLDGLAGLAAELEVAVSARDLSAMSCGGWYDEDKAEIVLDETASADEQVRTLAHELCHAQGIGYDLGRARAEVIVEAAAYIATWGERDDLAALREDLARIDEVAGRIEAACGIAEAA